VFRRHTDQPPAQTNVRRRGNKGKQSNANGLRSIAADAQEQIILEALEDLRDTMVREVMTPRVDVVALPIPLSAEDVTRAVRESGHSCFPVYDENLDNLIGVLFMNDLFRAGWKVGIGRSISKEAPEEPGARPEPDPVDISRRLRQPFLVPESRLVLEVLAEMRQQRRAFAVVVDEHGGVEGVLTVKDVLGALVGDLPDEFDPDDEPDIVPVDSSRWLVDGRMNVDDVRDRMGIDLPDGEYVTLGGFLFDGFGHIPSEGEVLKTAGWEFRVAEMDKRRVAKVVAQRTRPMDSGTRPGEPGSARTPVG
jgi:CBS domain containing-hemolysin-like protein